MAAAGTGFEGQLAQIEQQKAQLAQQRQLEWRKQNMDLMKTVLSSVAETREMPAVMGMLSAFTGEPMTSAGLQGHVLHWNEMAETEMRANTMRGEAAMIAAKAAERNVAVANDKLNVEVQRYNAQAKQEWSKQIIESWRTILTAAINSQSNRIRVWELLSGAAKAGKSTSEGGRKGEEKSDSKTQTSSRTTVSGGGKGKGGRNISTYGDKSTSANKKTWLDTITKGITSEMDVGRIIGSVGLMLSERAWAANDMDARGIQKMIRKAISHQLFLNAQMESEITR